MRILVVGRGAREHALVWRLARSPGAALYCAPGNAGTELLAESVPIKETDIAGLAAFAQQNRFDLVVVGPEAPLALGLADAVQAAGIPVFGPTRAAAEIESNKAFAKTLMRREGVPTARFERFRDAGAALGYLDKLQTCGASVVVKAVGLAAGKGAVVCDSLDEARDAVRRMLSERIFGEAGEEILIEERLLGEEVSRFDLCDGITTRALPSAQDYKRSFDGDLGPNTGGMGAYAPAPVMDVAVADDVSERIVGRVLRALSAEGRPYRGCLYTGLILTQTGPQVIEFNARLGDPEAEAILPLLEGDFAGMLLAAALTRLSEVEVGMSSERAVCVVMASPGYPNRYPTGLPIEGLDEAERLPGVTVFHAGTRREGQQVLTDGGRVLAITAAASTYRAAAARAYEAASCIHFEGAHYRRDIARRVLEYGTTEALK
jgi:phosphoribosylamine--glycine ligase